GGGGGGDSRAIIDIDGSSEHSKVRITRSSGRSEEIDFKPTIQNTPAYTLTINNQGWYNQAEGNMKPGDGNKKGVPISSFGEKVTCPVWMYDYAGTKLGGEYDQTTGEIYIAASSVEVKLQCSYHLGVHPDYPAYSSGRPKGEYMTRMALERKNPDGSWTEVGGKDVWHFTENNYPNSTHLNVNAAAQSVTIPGCDAGWYRVVYSIVSFGDNNPAMLPYMRWFATANDWFSGNSSKHYFQVTGTIKATSQSTPITPIPKP
ncbi:MAG: hypothetical protein ACRC29_02315, partial [Enterobacterales bacterium]